MKILLINPPIFNDLGRVLADTPPLGLLYIAAFMEKNGYGDIKVIDADAAKLSWADLENLLLEGKPDIVGITGASLVLPAILKTAEISKKILPQSKVIVGGFGASNEPKKVLRSSNKVVDFVVIREGELTFLELIKALENKKDNFKDIAGVAYLDGQNNFMITENRKNIPDLNVLPWPAYHLLFPKFSAYKGIHAGYMSMPNAVMVASRGCPHRCAFCSLGANFYRRREPKDIVAEMEFYVNEFGVKSIQLYDDEFIGMSPQQNEWVEEICREIIIRGLNKKLIFLAQGRCSQFVELAVLKKMKEAGFNWIWWGVESGSQKILDFITKDIKVENVVRDISLAKKAGIKSMIYIMVGFPKETLADIKLTVKLIKKVKANAVRIHILSPYPGSKLRKYLEENNLLETSDYYKFDSRINVIHHTEEMTKEQIKKNYRYLVFRFENGYWYFIKFFFNSLFTIDGWRKLSARSRMIFMHLFEQLKFILVKK